MASSTLLFSCEKNRVDKKGDRDKIDRGEGVGGGVILINFMKVVQSNNERELSLKLNVTAVNSKYKVCRQSMWQTSEGSVARMFVVSTAIG